MNDDNRFPLNKFHSHVLHTQKKWKILRKYFTVKVTENQDYTNVEAFKIQMKVFII